MLKNVGQYLATTVVILSLVSGCAKEVSPAEPSNEDPKLPTPAAPAWRQVEASISDAALGFEEGKCEWEVWGWMGQERYIWTFCQTGPEVNATAVSLPMVVHLATDGSVESIKLAQEGPEYTLSVQRLFPPAVQDKIFANEFDLYAAVSHLETRWNYPSMPPSIFARTGESLPAAGSPATRAISAESVNKINEYARLGQGNIKQIQYLPDDRIVTKGDLGIGFLDLVDGQIQYQYQELLVGRDGFLSPDGKLLAVVNDQTIKIIDIGTQTIKVTIDTYEVDGNILKVQFLPDGMTLIVEKNVPSEGFSPSKVALYQLDDGTIVKTWQLKGANIALSPNGWVLTSLYDTSGLQLWSVVRSELMYTLPDIASAVSFSGDGQIMAAVGLGKVHLYWVWDGFEIGRLQKNIGSVSGVALSPNGKLVLTWSDGPYPAQVWQVPDFKPVATLDIQGVTAAAFNQEGTSIVLAGNTAIGVYDVASGELKQIPSDTYFEVEEISFAPTRTFSQGQRLAVLYQSGTITNWEIDGQSPLFVGQDFHATSLVYLPDPYGIAAGTTEKTVMLLDDEYGSGVRVFEGFKNTIMDLAANPSDQLAASSMNEVRIFSLANQDERRGRDIRIDGGWVDRMIWSCNPIAKTADGMIHVLDPNGEEVTQELEMIADGYETSLAAAPDCSQLLAANNTAVYRWKSSTWEELPAWEMKDTITSLAISQDGSLAAVGTSLGEIHLVDSKTGSLLRSLDGHKGQVTALEFSPDGRYLASGGTDGVVIIWGVE